MDYFSWGKRIIGCRGAGVPNRMLERVIMEKVESVVKAAFALTIG